MMLKIEWDNTCVKARNDAGQETVLLDVPDFLSNRSRLSMHELYYDVNGEMQVRWRWQDFLNERWQFSQMEIDSGRAALQMSADCRMLQQLMRHPQPMAVMLWGLSDAMAVRAEQLIGQFGIHRIYRGRTLTDLIGLRSQGFGLVLAELADDGANETLCGLLDLLAEDGRLLLMSGCSPRLPLLLSLAAETYQSYEISENDRLYEISGCDVRRELIAPVDPAALYHKVCDEAAQLVGGADYSADFLESLRGLAVRLEQIASFAQQQWRLDVKQNCLDLQEKVQYVLRNQNSKYSELYCKELEMKILG